MKAALVLLAVLLLQCASSSQLEGSYGGGGGGGSGASRQTAEVKYWWKQRESDPTPIRNKYTVMASIEEEALQTYNARTAAKFGNWSLMAELQGKVPRYTPKRAARVWFNWNEDRDYTDVCGFPCIAVPKSARDTADVFMMGVPHARWAQEDIAAARRVGAMVALHHMEPSNDLGIHAADSLAQIDIVASYSKRADIWLTHYTWFNSKAHWEESLEISKMHMNGSTAILKAQVGIDPENKALAAAYMSAGCDGNDRHQYKRVAYIKELMDVHGIALDMRGVCLHNVPEPIFTRVADEKWFDTKMNIIKRYKFTLAFENSILDDYVTEKFYQAFFSGALPVYWGAPNADEYAPAPHSHINALKYTPGELATLLRQLDSDPAHYAPAPHSYINALKYTPGELATLLRQLDSDPALYATYFEWKGSGSLPAAFLQQEAQDAYFYGNQLLCRLCRVASYRKDFLAGRLGVDSEEEEGLASAKEL